ncbi:MAG: sensor histidine kinase, partial [Methanosarcina sp.]
EKLYQSEDMVSVDFADYIRNLTDYLLKSYSLGNKKIKLKLNVEKVFLGMDTAVPLGIIINELVSNSLKHAFVRRSTGEISIELYSNELYEDNYAGKTGSSESLENNLAENRNNKASYSRSIIKNESDKLTLIVKDNGAGFPEELDFRQTNSLGLQLVTTLVDQIEGDIELDTKNGTEFKIRFLKQ